MNVYQIDNVSNTLKIKAFETIRTSCTGRTNCCCTKILNTSLTIMPI